MEQQRSLTPILDFLDPTALDYTQWLQVGMGLKESGYPLSLWEQWSQRDAGRYHPGECARKWEGFGRCGAAPVTAGTIVQMALDRGYSPAGEDYALDWDDLIGPASGRQASERPLVDKNWVEGRELSIPETWDPASQLVDYLQALFEPDELVGYVTESWQKDGRYVPTKGCTDRTAGQLIDALRTCKGDVGSVLGDYDPKVGAWIRFNPLDGKGVRNENVTEYRFALVESDSMELERQNAIIRELELPVAALVYSGKKSLHAIVHIDADSYEEYRRRVDYLYAVCKKNGLTLDQQNRNPSRLSRMPGVQRGENKQYLLDTGIGKQNFEEWKEWVEASTDDLPDTEALADVWNDLPPLAPPLIRDVLRQGHKLLLAGPSKAGKSFALIELCIAIAEGRPWLGFDCAQGRVLYVNLELDRASCLHRFRDVYNALGWRPEHLANLDIWNLRGRSVPMDQLAPRLIRRAAKKGYLAIVIDPIYKVITGDENSADQMAAFCNQFDKVCTELGCAVIYCHHHSKGAQGGKRSMDRASGSGVFARDPDALLDLIELEISPELRTQQENAAVCAVCMQALRRAGKENAASQDDACSALQMQLVCGEQLDGMERAKLALDIEQARRAAAGLTAWRIEGTLREFARFPAMNLWFDFPVHRQDTTGVLGDLQPDMETKGGRTSWKTNFNKRKTEGQRREERKSSLDTAFDACNMEGRPVAVSELAQYLGVTEKTVRNRLKEHGGFWVDGGQVGRK